jgi:hypothetical protein
VFKEIFRFPKCSEDQKKHKAQSINMDFYTKPEGEFVGKRLVRKREPLIADPMRDI